VRGELLRLLNAFDDVLVEPLMPYSAVITLDIGVLLRLSGLDMVKGNHLFLCPFHEFAADIFSAVTPSKLCAE
jgi:hypothetical protein